MLPSKIKFTSFKSFDYLHDYKVSKITNFNISAELHYFTQIADYFIILDKMTMVCYLLTSTYTTFRIPLFRPVSSQKK